jgi:hypothetical protein
MQPEKDKLLLRIGQSFEANATGPWAILATLLVLVVLLGFILIR